MRMCQPHWDRLKQAIIARGLGDMISSSGEELVKRITADDTLENFDPLMAAHNMIVRNALQCGGIEILVQREDGSHLCPLCEAESHGCTDWIEHAADGAAEAARERKPK